MVQRSTTCFLREVCKVPDLHHPAEDAHCPVSSSGRSLFPYVRPAKRGRLSRAWAGAGQQMEGVAFSHEIQDVDFLFTRAL